MDEIDYKKLVDEILSKHEESKISKEWKDGLKTDDKGKIVNSIENYLYYFKECPYYKDKLKYNDFLQQKEFNEKEWDDFDLSRAYNNIELDTTLSTHAKVDSSLNQIFGDNKYNPVQNYLNSVIWDGVKNIETIFIKCFEIEDTPLVRALSKKWFIAAVKRVFEPGCQFDNMIVLQGETGIGKTTFCRLLSNEFYSEIKFDEITNKDIVDKLNKTWIGIIDEMDEFDKKAMGTIKSFLSTRKDLVRLAYGRNTTTYYRHSIFIGSLNDETFLRDNTSSTERRFWVFKCNKKTKDNNISKILTKEVVDNLWAEAMNYYRENPNQYLDIESELQESFANAQKEFKTFTDDVVVDYLHDILDRPYVLVNGCFNDNNDFLKQYTGETFYNCNKSYINKIPTSSLIYVLKNVYKVERSAKYIALALSDEWEYKKIKYKELQPKGLYRKKQKEEYFLIQDIGDLPI